MKKNFYLTILLGCCFTFSSCKKDFLDVENTEQLFRQSYVKDLSSMQEFMNGNYVLLATYLDEGSTAAYPELVADNLRPLSFASTLMIPHYNWTQISDGTDGQNNVDVKPESKAMDALWRMSYQAIRMCNFVIEEVDKYRSENPSKADDIKGQALAIRAYLYFKLVNTFAQHYTYTGNASHLGVPYIRTSDITKPFSRQTVAEVYAGIIEDLSASIQLLPALAADVRLMNRNAAKALLARTYLFKEDFLNAKAMATEVANQFPLMTIAAGYPNDLFKFKNATQTESLFQLSPKSSGYFASFLGLYVNLASARRFVATSDVGQILTENTGDVRKNWIKDTLIGGSPIRLVKKFPAGVAPEISPTVTPPQRSYYHVVIRSSEMFLTVAEASAKSGDEHTARIFLDAVRKRADPTVASITATGTSLLDLIYKERRKELAFESLRMHDLQRWKKGVQRIDILPGSNQNLPYPNDRAIAPIPLSDVRLSGLIQNSGY